VLSQSVSPKNKPVRVPVVVKQYLRDYFDCCYKENPDYDVLEDQALFLSTKMISKLRYHYKQKRIYDVFRAFLKETKPDADTSRLDKKINELDIPSLVIYGSYNGFYYGPVREGKSHGFGELVYFNGDYSRGRFEKGELMDGVERITNDDDVVYEGEVRHGDWHGKWKRTLKDGTLQEGFF